MASGHTLTQPVAPSAEVSRFDRGLKCRLYRSDNGLAGTPADDWVLDALNGRARE
jgi:hypothetical protein